MATLNLTVDPRGAERGYRRAGRAGEEYTRSARRAADVTDRADGSFRRLRDSLFSLRGALAGIGLGLAVRQLGRFTTATINTANAIDKAAATAGIGAEQLQELRFAFGQLANVSDQDVDAALRRFQRRLDLARDGTGAAVDTLKKLNISLQQETPAALDETIRKLSEMAKQESITGEASQLFGEDAGPRLAAALAEGSVAIEDLRNEAVRLGIVFDDEALRASAALADQMNELNLVLSRNIQAGLLSGLAGDMGSLRDTISDPQFRQGLRDFGEFVGETISFLIQNAGQLERVAQAIGIIFTAATIGRAAGGGRGGALGVGMGSLVALLNDFRIGADEASASMQNLQESMESAGITDSGNGNRITISGGINVSPLDNLREQVEQQKELNEALEESEQRYKEVTRQQEINSRVEEFRASLREQDAGEALIREETAAYRDQLTELLRLRDAESRLREDREDSLGAMDRALMSALDGMQDAWADTFTDMFTGELDSFRDFADQMKNIWARTMGEMAAEQLMRPFQAAMARSMGMSPQQMSAQGIDPNASFSGMFQGRGFSAGGVAGGAATGATIGMGMADTAEGKSLATVGGAVGSYWGPLGSAIGSAFGSALGDSVGPQITEFNQRGVVGDITGNAGGPFNFDIFGGRAGDPLDILPDTNPFSVFSSRPNSEWFRLLSGTGPLTRGLTEGRGPVPGDTNRTPLATATGGLGRIAVSGEEDLADNERERAQRIVQQVAGMDTMLANALGESLTEVATEALQGTVTHVNSWLEGEDPTRNITDALTRRYQAALMAVDEDVANALGATQGATPENLGALAAALFTLHDAGVELPQTAGSIIALANEFSALQSGVEELNRAWMSGTERSLTDFNSAMTQLQETFSGLDVAIPSSRDAFRDLLSGLDLTTEQGRDMADSLLRVSGAFDATIGAINRVSQSIDDMLGATTESIRRQLETDRQTYARVREEANRMAAGLSDIQDPNRLQAEIQRIDSMTRDAFSLLGEAQREVMGPGFLDFIENVRQEGQEILSGLTDTVRQEESAAADKMMSSTNDFSVHVQNFGGAVNNMNAVVGNLAKALNVIPSQIQVTVTQDSAEVG